MSVNETCIDRLYSYSIAILNVKKPTVPFSIPLPSPLEPLTMMIISGRVPPGADRFDVNLMKGQDIALHFNPRFDQRKVVRNTRLDFRWGREECGPSLMPFRSSMDFELVILTTEQCYKVAVNGRHFIDFAHRVPFNSVTHVSMEGDVFVNALQVFNPGRFNAEHPHGPVAPPGPILLPDTRYQPLYNPDVPFTYPLKGLAPGMKICLSGHPTPSSFKTFQVNLLSGEDIALHLNPRKAHSTVVFNTHQGGDWSSEMRAPMLPHFSPGVYFDMDITVERDAFYISVSGTALATYPHRLLPLSRITALQVRGDLVVAALVFL